jgi:hypothetical protein
MGCWQATADSCFVALRPVGMTMGKNSARLEEAGYAFFEDYDAVFNSCGAGFLI